MKRSKNKRKNDERKDEERRKKKKKKKYEGEVLVGGKEPLHPLDFI